MIIAIDGPAASGKGTLAKKLAAHFGLRRLDTGLLYRAIAHVVVENGGDANDVEARRRAARSFDIAWLANEAALRLPGVGEAASIVAADPEVRAAILVFQRDFASGPPGAVLDGRDIGTVVCPDADAKLFVTATAEARATRRWKETVENGADISYDEILGEIRRRDARDSSRAISPLHSAHNAHLLDTTDLDIETAFRVAVDLISAS